MKLLILAILMLAIFILIFINLLVMHIYSVILRKKFIKKVKNKNKKSNIEFKKTVKKQNIFIRYIEGLCRYELRMIGHIPSHRIRKFLYSKIFLMKISKSAVIYGGAEIRAPWNIKIGENSIIGDEAKLDGRNGIIIRNNVNFSTAVWCWTDQHQVNSEDFSCIPFDKGKIIIEDYCWCGPRSTILPGKILKKGSVLAAGGVLTKDTEEFGIYGGIPAQKIGERNKNLKYTLSSNYIPFY